jgi:hypothetical protein
LIPTLFGALKYTNCDSRFALHGFPFAALRTIRLRAFTYTVLDLNQRSQLKRNSKREEDENVKKDVIARGDCGSLPEHGRTDTGLRIFDRQYGRRIVAANFR